MASLEVLVTTMHQKDLSKYTEMNLQSNAVIANQADRDETVVNDIAGKTVAFVTTSTRGLSKNRNIAIKNTADSDYIIFSDDDLIFYDGYEKAIVEEFEKHPEADAIKFNINCIAGRGLGMAPFEEFSRLNRRQVSYFGVCALAIKTKILREKNILFNERFGTGTDNYCGEDTIFMQELLKKKVSMYSSPVFVADIDLSQSTWYEGITERRIITSGMVICECYPLLCYLIVLRSAYKFSKREECNLSFIQLLKCYYKGIRKNKVERKNG